MSGGDFDSVLKITMFCCCLFFMGQFCKMIKVSPIIGEIIIGVVLGPNAADLVPYESFFRLAGLFGVTLMIFESGLHVDFGMLKEVGAKATGVAILGTLMPLGSGMLLMMAFDDTYTLWPVGLACGVTLAPTSVGMALKMLGEKKQLGEKYGQLIIAAAFIDDILSLVALTMLLQIGDAEASGEGVSLWGVFQPLVWSVLFCVGGAMLSFDMGPRKTDDGFVKRILLRWVGFYPEFVPKLVAAIGQSEDEQANALIAKEKKIMETYNEVLLPKVNKIIEDLQTSVLDGTATPSSPTSLKDEVGKQMSDGEKASASKTMRDAKGRLEKVLSDGAGRFKDLAKRKAAEKHHDEHITESDLAQSIIHVKSHVFEVMLKEVTGAIGSIGGHEHLVKALEKMALSHEIIHEWKGSADLEQIMWGEGYEDHKENDAISTKTMQDIATDIDLKVESHMESWKDTHTQRSEVASLGEIKEQVMKRLEVCFKHAAEEVEEAIRHVRGEHHDEEVEKLLFQTVQNNLANVLDEMKEAVQGRVQDSSKKRAGGASREIDVIKLANAARSKIWDLWMDEVIVSFIGTFTEGEITADHAVVSGLVKLNQIQTELFQSHKGDIFDQHVQTADDLVHFHGVNRLQASAGQDPLLWARMKLRGEQTEEPTADEDDHGHGSHKSVELLRQNQLVLFLMFGVLVLYGWVANLIGSHLLGAFIAGMSFCWMDAALILWQSQVKRIANWLIRLFFGATVAFAIPIDSMMDAEAVWKGLLLGVGPCCFTKIAAGFFTGGDKWVVGFAMVGRGEFAYLVAQTAQEKLLNPALDSFTADTDGLRLMSGGYYCVDLNLDDHCDGLVTSNSTLSGNCSAALLSTAHTAGRRQLSAGGGGASGEDEAPMWCKHSSDGGEVWDTLPVVGEHYWQVGDGCNDHVLDCDCDMMMPAKAFSICVWALVLASLLAPIGFGKMLSNKLAAEKEAKDVQKEDAAEVKVAGATAAATALETDGDLETDGLTTKA